MIRIQNVGRLLHAALASRLALLSVSGPLVSLNVSYVTRKRLIPAVIDDDRERHQGDATSFSIWHHLDTVQKKADYPNGAPRFTPGSFVSDWQRRLASPVCQPQSWPGRMASKANMLFNWRRRFLADQQAQSAALIPVVLLNGE